MGRFRGSNFRSVATSDRVMDHKFGTYHLGDMSCLTRQIIVQPDCSTDTAGRLNPNLRIYVHFTLCIDIEPSCTVILP